MSATKLLKALARRSLRAAEKIVGPLWPGAAISVKDISRGLPKIGQRIAPPYFQGRYATMAEAGQGSDNPYDAEPWVETAEFVVRDLLSRYRSPDFAMTAHLLPLATLIAGLSVTRDRVRVLDFGGGLGDNFIQLASALADGTMAKVEYHIVDTPRNCLAGAELLTEFSDRLYFHSGDAEHGAEYAETARLEYDVLMLCGTLMYIDDWRGLLVDLASRTRDSIYVCRTPANLLVPTFYVRQLLAPAVGPWAGRFIGSIPMAIINPAEIADLLQAHGFEQQFFAPLFAYGPEISTNPPPHGELMQAMNLFSRGPAKGA